MPETSRDDFESGAPSIVRFGRYTFNRGTLELRLEGRPVGLAPKPTAVLEKLLERAGQLVERDELYEHVWPDTVIEFDQGLNGCMRDLRAALRDSARRPQYIQTVARRGYRFVAAVSPEVAAEVHTAGRNWRAPGARPAFATGFAPRSFVAAVVIGLGLVTSALAYRAGGSRGEPVALLAAPRSEGRLRVAVLPFSPADSTASAEIVAGGLMEEVVAELARADPDRLEVLASSSTRSLAPDRRVRSAITLGVDYVVEGTVQGGGAGAPVLAALVRDQEGTVVWSGILSGPQPDAGALRPLAENVRSWLLPAVLDSPVGPGRLLDLSAPLRLTYLAARFHVATGARAGAERALPLFQEVLDERPDFLPALGGRAAALSRLGRFAESLLDAEAILRADPESDVAFSLRGMGRLRHWDIDGARDDLSRAVALAPGVAHYHHSLAYVLVLRGDVGEARDAWRRALALDPFSVVLYGDVGLFEYWTGRFEESFQACTRARALTPDAADARPVRCALRSARRTGRVAEAREAALTVMALAGADPEELARVRDGDESLAEYVDWASDSAHVMGAEGGDTPYHRALAAADAGRGDEAIARLDEALLTRAPALLHALVEPRFDALRGDPRFERIVRALAATPKRQASR